MCGGADAPYKGRCLGGWRCDAMKRAGWCIEEMLNKSKRENCCSGILLSELLLTCADGNCNILKRHGITVIPMCNVNNVEILSYAKKQYEENNCNFYDSFSFRLSVRSNLYG